MAEYREGTTYLTVRPDHYWANELKVIKATQGEPSSIDADCVVVKLKLRIPKAAFKPLEPEAVVTVPEELVQHPVEVEAVDPDA